MIFISYSTRPTSKKFAGVVKSELEQHHFPCFLAHEDVKESEDWMKRILAELRSCSGFLGLVDPAFNQSEYCQQELGAALGSGKEVLLVSRDRKTHPKALAQWVQSAKPARIVPALQELPAFRTCRAAAYVEGITGANSFDEANAVHKLFAAEWDTMTLAEKLEWLRAAANNSQARNEQFKIGPFFKKKCLELREHLTTRWLAEADPTNSIRSELTASLMKGTRPIVRKKSRSQQLREM